MLLILPRSLAGRAGLVGCRHGRVSMGCWTHSRSAGGLVRAVVATAAVVLFAQGACAAKGDYDDNAASGGGGSETDSVTQTAGGAAVGAEASGADGDGSGTVLGPGLAMAPPAAAQQLTPPAPQAEEMQDPELAPMPEDGLQTAGVPVDSAPPDPAPESAQQPENNADGGAAVADGPPQEVPAPPDMPDEMAGLPPPPMPMEGPGPDAAQDGVQDLPAIPEGGGGDSMGGAAIGDIQRAIAAQHAQRIAKGKHNMISQFMKNFARNMRYSVLEDSEGDMPEEERRRMMDEIDAARGGPPPGSSHHEDNALPIEQITEQMRPRFRSGRTQHEEHARRHRHRFHMLNQGEAPAAKKRRRHNFHMLNTQSAATTSQDAAAPAVADSAAAPPIEPIPAEGSPPPESSNAVPGTTIPLLQLGQPLGLAAVPRSSAQSMTGTVNVVALIVACLAAIGEM